MNITRILSDMKETLARKNERYEVIDSKHVKDLITDYKSHFYPDGTMHVTKDDLYIIDGSQLDAQSMMIAKEIGQMIRNHYATEFITEHAKLYDQQPQQVTQPQQAVA